MTTTTAPPAADTPAGVTAQKAVTMPAGRMRRRSDFADFVERKLGLTVAGLSLIVLAAGAFALGQKTSNRGIVLLSYGLAMLVVMAWVLGRRNLPVTADRGELPSRVRIGRPVEVGLRLMPKRRINTVILADRLPPQLGEETRIPVATLAGGAEGEYTYAFTPVNRGVYELGPLLAETSDPFGLTVRRQEIAPKEKVVVHPRVEPVSDMVSARAFEDPPIRPPFSRPWPSGNEFYGMRDYAYGDDPRRIVWRALAQYDKYLVRESEQGILDRVTLLVDTDKRFHSPGTVSQTFEAAVSSAASLAVKHLTDGMSISLHTNEDVLADNLRGETHRIRLLDKLAEVTHDELPFDKKLERFLASAGRGQHTVLITPHMTREAASRIRLLAERGTSLLLVFVVWDDTDPAAMHRVSMLGCPVVEVHAGAPLSRAFRNVMSGGSR